MAHQLSTAVPWTQDPVALEPTDQLVASRRGAFEVGGIALRLDKSNGPFLPTTPSVDDQSSASLQRLNVRAIAASRSNETALRSASDGRAASQLLAEWHGQVLEVLSDSFVAELKGKHGEAVAGRDEDAVIPIKEVRPDDLDLLAPGAFFRLCVSYSLDANGTRRRITDVVFRRLPAYRRDELEQARERGRELARGLRLE